MLRARVTLIFARLNESRHLHLMSNALLNVIAALFSRRRQRPVTDALVGSIKLLRKVQPPLADLKNPVK